MKSQISIRLENDVIQAITESAKAQGRNRNQQVEWLLRVALNTGIDPTFPAGAFMQDAETGSAPTRKVTIPEGYEIPKRRLCKRHPNLGMFEDECKGVSCQQDRLAREARGM